MELVEQSAMVRCEWCRRLLRPVAIDGHVEHCPVRISRSIPKTEVVCPLCATVFHDDPKAIPHIRRCKGLARKPVEGFDPQIDQVDVDLLRRARQHIDTLVSRGRSHRDIARATGIMELRVQDLLEENLRVEAWEVQALETFSISVARATRVRR